VIYTLDSNVLVDALRDAAGRTRLRGFLGWALGFIEISSVVAAELEAGARTPAARRELDDAILAPFHRRGRIVAPSEGAWRRMGELLSELPPAAHSAARQNDALLAVQARQRGWTVITRDRDFEELRARVKGLRVAAPFPPDPRT
jgi:predicted nucleic acid-binding protein